MCGANDLYRSDNADRTASNFDETMHEAARSKEKEAELYFLHCTLASSLYSHSLCSLPFYLIALSPSLSRCSHTQMHTHRKEVKTREAQWGYSAYVGSKASGQQPLQVRTCV